MRIALTHDYLNQYGGGERVLETLSEIFPKAPIYTLFYDKDKTRNRFEGKIGGTSFLNNRLVANNHRFFIPMMPMAANLMNLMNLKSDYDLVISSSAGFGKGIGHFKQTHHISYIHTPLRYAWESDQYFDWHPAMKLAAAPMFGYLRQWDKKAGQKPDTLLANSHFIAEKIKKYYNRESEVIYPPVDLSKFYKADVRRGGYFLAVGRLLPYKRFDLIIEAFNRLNWPLLIVGDGPELANLKSMVKSKKIEFYPFVDENDLRTFYSGAEALVFPQVEDFGLVAAEAQACGCPVIAFSQGGAREIVTEGVTGVFFHKQTVEDLVVAVKRFLLTSFNEDAIQKSAEKFSKEKFKKAILEIVKRSQIAYG